MDFKEQVRQWISPDARSLLGLMLESGGAGDEDVTIAFTDIADHTSFTDRLGDDAARALVKAHDRIVRAELAGVGGREVKHTGDGIMASFPSAARALRFAVSVQRSVAAWNARHEPAAPLRVAIGLNSGSPIADHGDLFGTAVIVASRITDRAAGDQILVADVVRQLASGKGFTFLPRGSETLEGLSEAVPLFEVVWQQDSAAERAAAG
ncbi:MAG TPA: adenylate/guanylate cyclase domain-containing protein [Candidatus Limnocylindrales bacterium]|nr:adenylate/guanylate cyclase domain-containing protein [Candidatus Limnocylindrales bacterium]